jgi:hypothetical protein
MNNQYPRICVGPVHLNVRGVVGHDAMGHIVLAAEAADPGGRDERQFDRPFEWLSYRHHRSDSTKSGYGEWG